MDFFSSDRVFNHLHSPILQSMFGPHVLSILYSGLHLINVLSSFDQCVFFHRFCLCFYFLFSLVILDFLNFLVFFVVLVKKMMWS